MTDRDDKVDILCEGLDAVEAGDEADGQPATLEHLATKEEVFLEVVHAEIVFTVQTQTILLESVYCSLHRYLAGIFKEQGLIMTKKVRESDLVSSSNKEPMHRHPKA